MSSTSSYGGPSALGASTLIAEVTPTASSPTHYKLLEVCGLQVSLLPLVGLSEQVDLVVRDDIKPFSGSPAPTVATGLLAGRPNRSTSLRPS